MQSKQANSNLFRNPTQRLIFTGLRISVTGVFPDSSGGVTEYRLTIAMNVVRSLLPKACLLYARNADAHTLPRIRIHWIHGSHLLYGHSQHLAGRKRQKNWITSIRQMFLLPVMILFSSGLSVWYSQVMNRQVRHRSTLY